MSVEFKLFKSYTNFSAGRSLSHFRSQLAKSRLVPMIDEFPQVQKALFSGKMNSPSHLVFFGPKENEIHATKQSTGEWTIEQRNRGMSFSLRWVDGSFNGQSYLVCFTLDGKITLTFEGKDYHLTNSFRRVYYSSFDREKQEHAQSLAANRNIIETQDGFIFVTELGAVALVRWSSISEVFGKLDIKNHPLHERLTLPEDHIFPTDSYIQHIVMQQDQIMKLDTAGTITSSHAPHRRLSSFEAIRIADEVRDRDFLFTCFCTFKSKVYASAFSEAQQIVRVFKKSTVGQYIRSIDFPAAFHIDQMAVCRGVSSNFIYTMQNNRRVYLLCDKHSKLLMACRIHLPGVCNPISCR